MASCKYIADSALLIPLSLAVRARSDATGGRGCAIAPGVGCSADHMSVSSITPSID
jgi:hypothetical protein